MKRAVAESAHGFFLSFAVGGYFVAHAVGYNDFFKTRTVISAFAYIRKGLRKLRLRNFVAPLEGLIVYLFSSVVPRSKIYILTAVKSSGRH